MVKDLPKSQQPRALRYGMAGAFVFRGFSLLGASLLIRFVWLKIIGGLYLLYLVYGHFSPKKDTIEEGVNKNTNKIYLKIKKWIGPFWSTVILVEFMDMAFSIDNIFAAVAMTTNFYIIIAGVFAGIIAMRFVATWFTVLLRKYPSMESSAFIVILLLGVRLIFSGIIDSLPESNFVNYWHELLSDHRTDIVFSALMIILFVIPIWRSKRIKISGLR